MSEVSDENNAQSVIPASQRPDGTWRKARRVKEGYVPQEEVPLYESKGKKFKNKQLQQPDPVKVDGFISHKTIPGLFIVDKPEKKEKKKKNTAVLSEKLGKMNINSENKSDLEIIMEPEKKLKNLKKRLREVEALELKIKNGKVAKPEPDQLAKVARKNDLILQIHEIEKSLL